MKRLVVSLLGFSFFGILAACEPRGQLTTLPLNTQIPETATVHDIYVGTTRADSGDGQVFGPNRSQETAFARFSVSVPPAHVPGEIEWPKEVPDPSKHFVVRDAVRINSATSFQQDLARTAASGSSGDRGVSLFVHGYNMNFSEALYRFTQAHHDFENENIPVLFTWASAATTVGYLYDRDSALLARDNLVEFIKTVERSAAGDLTLIAHSMGSFLLMEALRQLATTEGLQALDEISGVILMSPDIDLQVFEAQARAIGDLPQPFVVFSSQADRALMVSRSLARDERLGSVDSVERLEELDVTVIDVTALSERRSLNHLTTITSPEFIDLVVKLGDFGENLDGDIAQAEGFTMVEVFDRAREITLAPFQN